MAAGVIKFRAHTPRSGRKKCPLQLPKKRVQRLFLKNKFFKKNKFFELFEQFKQFELFEKYIQFKQYI